LLEHRELALHESIACPAMGLDGRRSGNSLSRLFLSAGGIKYSADLMQS